VSIILVLLNTWSLFAATNTKELSTQVIELRQQVELLNDEYKTEREKVINELKALSIQKAELSANVRAEKIRQEQLSEKLSHFKKEIEKNSFENEKLLPILQKNMTEIRSYISQSLPFKQSERLETLNGLEDRINKKEVSPTKAANLLWAMIEDENRLAKDISIHKQTISLGENRVLAEVAKVGMLFLYFKTENDQLGMAVKEADGWVFKTFQNKEDRVLALTLMESLKKQIRQGYFAVPTAI
jgi:hypothetical protein